MHYFIPIVPYRREMKEVTLYNYTLHRVTYTLQMVSSFAFVRVLTESEHKCVKQKEMANRSNFILYTLQIQRKCTIMFYALLCYCVFSSFSFHDINVFHSRKKNCTKNYVLDVYFYSLYFVSHIIASHLIHTELKPNETENIRIIIHSEIALTNILPDDQVEFVYRNYFFSLSLFHFGSIFIAHSNFYRPLF